ncbi:MAG: hypothetical protein VW257_04850, partial [Quisquiliibacterium sp.]
MSFERSPTRLMAFGFLIFTGGSHAQKVAKTVLSLTALAGAMLLSWSLREWSLWLALAAFLASALALAWALRCARLDGPGGLLKVD